MMSFKLYIVSIMNDKQKGFAALFVKGILYFLSIFYALAIKIIDWAYLVGLRRVYKVDAPVISVGNLTLGGTGKTPFTLLLADYFQTKGRRCAVLTRGYGMDESLMLKEELAEVPVFVGQDRVKQARLALSGGSDIVVLDDGFQHKRLKRSLDILLLDSCDPFGNGFLFPRGILREPFSAAKRADVFVLTKIDKAGEDRCNRLSQKLEEMCPGKTIIKTQHRASFLTDVQGAAYPLDGLRGRKVFLLSGIGDPDYFATLVSREGAVIEARCDYPDHHQYSQKDIERVEKCVFEGDIEKIIVTKKDYIKLKKLDLSSIESKLFVLNIVIDVVEGKESLFAGLNSVVSG